MATHNGARYLHEQVQSILSQLSERDELIVSDDSSTDGTLDIAKAFGDPRIKILAGNRFFNPIYNFENAIRRAEGEGIVLSDQDDIWLDNKLPAVRNWLDTANHGVRVLVLDGLIVDESGETREESLFEVLKSGKGIRKNIYRNTYMGCCMAFTRQLLRVALPFPAGIPMHDSWLGLLGEVYGTVEFLPVKTIKYRRHRMNKSLQPFTVRQQLMWRFALVYQLSKRVLAHPPIFQAQR